MKLNKWREFLFSNNCGSLILSGIEMIGQVFLRRVLFGGSSRIRLHKRDSSPTLGHSLSSLISLSLCNLPFLHSRTIHKRRTETLIFGEAKNQYQVYVCFLKKVSYETLSPFLFPFFLLFMRRRFRMQLLKLCSKLLSCYGGFDINSLLFFLLHVISSLLSR